MTWCEHCRDHFPESHYENDMHKIGKEFGPWGEDQAELRDLRAEVRTLRNAAVLEQEKREAAEKMTDELRGYLAKERAANAKDRAAVDELRARVEVLSKAEGPFTPLKLGTYFVIAENKEIRLERERDEARGLLGQALEVIEGRIDKTDPAATLTELVERETADRIRAYLGGISS